MPLCHYPKVAVKGFANVILCKPGYIYIGKPGEAGKDEQVPDVFQPLGNHFLFKDNFNLVLCQITPVHFLQPDFVAGERVAHQYTVVAGNDDDALEELHELGGSVVAALAGGTQIQLKIGNEHRGNLLNGHIRYVVLAADKFGKVSACDFILAVGRYRLGYADKLLHIVIVLLEQRKDCFVALAMT